MGKILTNFVNPSKLELLVNKFLQNGERVRVSYAGKQITNNPEIAKFVEELGLKKPTVMIGANGRGTSGVAGIVVKDGKKEVLRAAGGIDYNMGERPVVQLRGRVAEGQGARLNLVADLNKQVNPENLAVGMSNKGGKLNVSLDSDLVRGNLTADMNSPEMKIPSVKGAYDNIMKVMAENINCERGLGHGIENLSKKLNKFKDPFAPTPMQPANKIVADVKPKEVKDVASQLRNKAEAIEKETKIAEQKAWKQKLMDEDCEFIARRAKEINKSPFDPEILNDPEIIKHFRLG